MQESHARFKMIDTILHPNSIAVVGASDAPFSFGYHYVRYLQEGGFEGNIFCVNPSYDNILGLPSYPSLNTVPDDVDYIICCLKAELVIDLLRQCPEKKVKAVQMFTGRLSETGDPDATRLEQNILEVARDVGVRLIGPNCMGLYHPKQRITFNYDLPMEPGRVGCLIQSGGIAGEFVRYAGLRGVRFSKCISYGNALDLNECDFLDYLRHDPDTDLIALYIEGTREGPRLLNTLRDITPEKPVICLKGGRGRAGIRASASHTAAIAGSMNTWEVLFQQSNVIQTSCLEELVDTTVSFSMLSHIKDKKTFIVGGGGGKGVLSADECEEAGLIIHPLPREVKQIFRKVDPKLEAWLGNPVDISVLLGNKISSLEILQVLARNQEADLLIANLTEDSPLGGHIWEDHIRKEAAEYISIAESGLKPIVVIMPDASVDKEKMENWRWKTLSEERGKLVSAGIPVYSNVKRAASAISRMVSYYNRVNNR